MTGRLLLGFILLPNLVPSQDMELGRDCDSLLGIERAFVLHYFQPSFNGFFDVLKSFLMSLALRKTPRKCRNFGYIVALFILFNYHMQSQGSSVYYKSYNEVLG